MINKIKISVEKVLKEFAVFVEKKGSYEGSKSYTLKGKWYCDICFCKRNILKHEKDIIWLEEHKGEYEDIY